MDLVTGYHSMTVATVDLTGRLDALTAPALRRALRELLEGGSRQLLVDLSAVEFVDSAGLAALVRGLKDARLAGGDLRLVRPAAEEAMRVFRLTRFDRVFELLDRKPVS